MYTLYYCILYCIHTYSTYCGFLMTYATSAIIYFHFITHIMRLSFLAIWHTRDLPLFNSLSLCVLSVFSIGIFFKKKIEKSKIYSRGTELLLLLWVFTVQVSFTNKTIMAIKYLGNVNPFFPDFLEKLKR